MSEVLKYSPWTFLRELSNEMNTLWDQKSTGGDISQVETSQWCPRVDIKEEADKYIILADLPGVDPKEIKISMENNVLTLKGERYSERDVKEGNYARRERIHGTFYRRFTLPAEADGQRIKAKGKHGVLEIKIPKKEPHVPKEIEVEVED